MSRQATGLGQLMEFVHSHKPRYSGDNWF